MNPPVDCPFQKFFPSEMDRDDGYYMKLAYNQAIEAWRKDEVPIGAVIVYEDRVIGAAYNRVIELKDPTAHAEMLALTQAAKALGDWRLNGAKLYVTKEPCPMCSGASIMSRLGEVVYAWGDPKMGCLGGATGLHTLPRLNHHLQVRSGILLDECKELLQSFFKMKRSQGVDLEQE